MHEIVREVIREPEAVTTALIAVGGTIGGVVLGWWLQWWSSKRVRIEERKEQRAIARHDREIAVAERMDDALVNVMAAFRGVPDPQAWMQAFNDWADGWVAFSQRIGDNELRERYQSVGTMLQELIDADQIHGRRISAHHAVDAIRNARAALAHFIRDQGELPPSSFPGPEELVRLLNEGSGQRDPLGPLREWQRQQREGANAVQTSSTLPSSALPPPEEPKGER